MSDPQQGVVLSDTVLCSIKDTEEFQQLLGVLTEVDHVLGPREEGGGLAASASSPRSSMGSPSVGSAWAQSYGLVNFKESEEYRHHFVSGG